MTIKQSVYYVSLPSTGEKVAYRPFVVKEEKALLLALQEGDPFTIVNSIKDLVRACTFEKLDTSKITYFDLEYMFLMIRAKAVGETVDMIGFCDCSDKARTPFIADLEEAYVEGLTKDANKIVLPNTDYGVMMKYPSIDDIIGDEPDTEQDAIEKAARMIEYVWNDEEVFDTWDTEKKVEFIESLTPKQQQPIAKFIKNIPSVQIPANYICKACGKEHKTKVQGLENFFV